MSNNPWKTTADRANAFVNLDRDLAARLAELSRKQSRDTKLASAIEEGRTYPMRQMHSQMLQQKALNRDIKRNPLTVKSW